MKVTKINSQLIAIQNLKFFLKNKTLKIIQIKLHKQLN